MYAKMEQHLKMESVKNAMTQIAENAEESKNVMNASNLKYFIKENV